MQDVDSFESPEDEHQEQRPWERPLKSNQAEKAGHASAGTTDKSKDDGIDKSKLLSTREVALEVSARGINEECPIAALRVNGNSQSCFREISLFMMR